MYKTAELGCKIIRKRHYSVCITVRGPVENITLVFFPERVSLAAFAFSFYTENISTKQRAIQIYFWWQKSLCLKEVVRKFNVTRNGKTVIKSGFLQKLLLG